MEKMNEFTSMSDFLFKFTLSDYYTDPTPRNVGKGQGNDDDDSKKRLKLFENL